MKAKTSKKILFVTHTLSIYGASRSLEGLLCNLQGDISLVVPTLPWKKAPIVSEIGKRFSVDSNKVFPWFLPYRDCFVGESAPWSGKLKRLLKNLIWRFFYKNRFSRWIKKSGFDLVHLNSLCLVDLIESEPRMSLHVRERWNKNDNLLKKIFPVAGLVFIDSSTKESLCHKPSENFHTTPMICLPNPTDLVIASDEESHKIRRNLLREDSAALTLFSIIGRIDFPGKGVDFLIENFLSLNDPNARLLLFGAGHAKEIARAKKIANQDARILFLGEQSDQTLIYACTDIVLRGENAFAIGRSIQEGLVAGCRIIMPAPLFDRAKHSDLSTEMFSQISFYEARNSSSLVKALQSNSGFQRKKPLNLDSSAKPYAEKISQFLERISSS